MDKPPFDAGELTIGQLAARSGVAVTALRFYERKGLIRSDRTGGNQRRYPRDTLRRIGVIQVAQRVGIPLGTVAKALQSLPDERTPTREDWEGMSEAWHQELEARIDQLVRLRDRLTDCIGCGCLSIDACLLRNRDDRLGDTGTGPRRLISRYLKEEPRRPGDD